MTTITLISYRYQPIHSQLYTIINKYTQHIVRYLYVFMVCYPIGRLREHNAKKAKSIAQLGRQICFQNLYNLSFIYSTGVGIYLYKDTRPISDISHWLLYMFGIF